MSCLKTSLLSFIIICFANSLTLGSPVNLPTAEYVAFAKLANLPGGNQFAVAGIRPLNHGGELLAYVCSLTPVGYLVISADDELPPVIAYSLTSFFRPPEGEKNLLGEMLISDLQQRRQCIEDQTPAKRASILASWERLLSNQKQDRKLVQWPPAGSTVTGGWLTTNWHQNPPYNNQCPMDLQAGSRSLAGCPSIAMAQILNYFAATNGTRFDSIDRYYHSYAGNYYWIDDDFLIFDFPSFSTLNASLTSLDEHYAMGIDPPNEEKAALVFACGVAATQVYNAGGSGTFGVGQAFDAFQRFGFSSSRLIMDSNPDFYDDLSQNMMDAIPAHLAVVNPGWTAGHNVVVDGYNTDQYYHLNFGWGGVYNGWYLLPDEIPYSLTVIEGLIVDIQQLASPVPENLPGLSQVASIKNHPNPFNPRTTVEFVLPSATMANVSIFDLRGNKVVTLVNEFRTAGRHSLVWNGNDDQGRLLCSGVFSCRLQTQKGSATSLMVLVR